MASRVVCFASLTTACMSFNIPIGAASNAIAYESKPFTAGEFFLYGGIPSAILMTFAGALPLTSSGRSWACRSCSSKTGRFKAGKAPRQAFPLDNK